MNKTVIMKIHSIVDVITNSSTVIYTYQDNSIEPAKELVNEMLKLSGITDKTADDVFYYTVLYELNLLCDLYHENRDPEYKDTYDKIDSYIRDCIQNNDIPDWMIPTDSDDSLRSIELYITAKEPQYQDLADKLLKFLNSPNIDACHEG
jgi:hypothetical protein